MEVEAAQFLRAARASGEPDFITTPTRVESTGLLIPPIRYHTESEMWRLESDWQYRAPAFTLTIPHGYETDLASVPQPLRHFVNCFEFGITGPLLHDFLYTYVGCPPSDSCVPWRRFSRREVDDHFLSLMEEERVPSWKRRLGYSAVRLGGWTHWMRQRERQKGS